MSKDPIQFLIEAEEEKLLKRMNENKIDNSDYYNIKVTKLKYNNEFIGWEAELSFSDDGYYCSCSAPTMGGAIDEVMNYLYDSVYEWTKDDANERT